MAGAGSWEFISLNVSSKQRAWTGHRVRLYNLKAQSQWFTSSGRGVPLNLLQTPPPPRGQVFKYLMWWCRWSAVIQISANQWTETELSIPGWPQIHDSLATASQMQRSTCYSTEHQGKLIGSHWENRFFFLLWMSGSHFCIELNILFLLFLPCLCLPIPCPIMGLIFFQYFMWVFGIWIHVLKSILVQQAIYLLCHFFNPHLISLNIFFFLALFNEFLFTPSVYFRCNLLSGHLLVSSLLSHTLCLIRLSLSSLSQFVCYPQSPSPAALYSRSEISCIKNWNSQLPIISTQ